MHVVHLQSDLLQEGSLTFKECILALAVGYVLGVIPELADSATTPGVLGFSRELSNVFHIILDAYLLFDTAGQCCASRLAGNDCYIVDVCSNNWFGDYSRGWEDGVCVNSKDGNPIPKGRRTFSSQLECCLDAFLGQSSEACVSFLKSGEV